MKKKFAKITKLILFFLIIATVCYGGYKAWQAYQEYLRQEMTQTLTIDGEEFSFQKLSEMARKLSQSAYVAPAETLPESLKKLDYDQHRDIRFARDNGPWFGKKLPFEIQFFHLGSLFQVSVPINEVINGKTRPIKYSSNYFDYGKNKFNTEEFKNIGYAGFRLHTPLNTSSYYDELISFLGASYFRALAQDQKYGISARGLAIDTAVQTGEEFPIFREFWIERPTRRADSVTIYALLDSPSIAGAYKFVVTPGKTTVMNVESLLYPRKKINKLGIAPLTSMFLFGENTKNRFDDHRPEVHDSDGQMIANRNGELLAGRYADIQLKQKEIEDAIAIPSEAIVPEMGKNKVFVYRSGVADPVDVIIGLRTEAEVQIVRGLSVGDTILTSGTLQLRKGMPVELQAIN